MSERIFLSIFAATCRPKNIKPFLDNLAATCDDPSSFEILFKLDDGADDLIAIIEDYKKTSCLNIKYLATAKLEGYYTLDVGYNELLKMVDPETYFCWLLTDEIRFETKGWDGILKKYIGFYPDDIFRIKLSIFQLKNYTDFFECLPCPDNYAVTTRRWLEISGGWGNFWGPDSWHQCVDFYLALAKNEFNPYGIWRSFPIYDIKVGGQEAGQGIEDPAKLGERAIRIWDGWQKHSTHAAQENFNKLAQRLNAHIYACEKGIEQYVIREEMHTKQVVLYQTDCKVPYQSWSYKVPGFRLKLMNGRKALNLWHMFPRLYNFRWKFHRAYHLIKRMIRGLDLFRTSLMTVIEKTASSAKQILVQTFELINMFGWALSKVIENLLKIPMVLGKFIYRYLIKIFIILPEKMTAKINHALLAPVHFYKTFIANPIKGLIDILKKLAPLLHPFKSMDLLLQKLAGALRKSSKSDRIVSYYFDGKNLKTIDTTTQSEQALP